ncbi:gp436 family protein [Photobacterium sp.]|uniref:gp436 family protein n=1 Tax=Photobacterium sp. TaxID=660 RepID=UPI00299DD7A2|nr:phage protein Gp36 family protein [Photobacterium sp.]MDX1301190.1 phage protein Gp36 family protein [Photobacterium sp.]
MYCTRDDMKGRFGEQELIALTDRDGSAGAVVDSVLNQAIDDACATIDGYLGGRYSLPLHIVPRVLARTACDLARYYLNDDVLGDEHQVAKRYKDAISYLEKVGRGVLQLGVDSNNARPESNNTATITSAGSVFGRDRAKGFI